MEKHTVVAVDIAKSVFEVAVSNEPGRVAAKPRLRRGVFLSLLRTDAGFDGRHGSLRLRPLLGPAAPEAGPRRGPAPSPPGPTLRHPEQDRPHRRQGHPRSLPQRRHPPRPREVRPPTGPGLPPPLPLRLDRLPNRPGQHAAWLAPRAGHPDPARSGEGAPSGQPSSPTPTPAFRTDSGTSWPRPATRFRPSATTSS